MLSLLSSVAGAVGNLAGLVKRWLKREERRERDELVRRADDAEELQEMLDRQRRADRKRARTRVDGANGVRRRAKRSKANRDNW